MNNINEYFSDDAPLWLKQAVTEAVLQAQKDQANEKCAVESSLKKVSKSDEHEPPTKTKLLAKYLDNPVAKFKQYDFSVGGFFDPDRDDDYFSCDTYELMLGTSVRVLIRPDERKKDVVRILLKIAERINCSYDFK